MGTAYWWFKVDANGVKEQALTELSLDIMEFTIAQYIINPDNRDTLSNVPDLVSNIEKKTKNNTPNNNEVDMEYFNKTLKSAYDRVLNSEVKDLVSKHMKDDAKLKTTIKASRTNDSLKDLLDPSFAREWEGTALSLDKDLSAKQKKLLNNEVIYTNNEFFKGHTISSKKEKGKVLVTIEVNHQNKKVVKKHFKSAFPNRTISFDKDVKVSKEKGMGEKAPVSSTLTGIKTKLHLGGWGALSWESPKTIARYVNMFNNTHLAENEEDKKRMSDLENWARSANLAQYPKKTWDNKIANQIIRLIKLGKSTKRPSEKMILGRFNIQIEEEKDNLKDGIKEVNEKHFEDFVKQLIANGKLYKHLVSAHSSNLEVAYGGIDFSINRPSIHTIKLTFDSNNKPNKSGKYQLDSSVKQKFFEIVNPSGLFAGKGTTYLTKPLVGRGKSKQHFTQFARSQKIREKGSQEGYNKARNYFIKMVKNNIKKLTNAANDIGITLEE